MAAGALAVLVLGPPVQVLAARWIDPPMTLTMLDRAWSHRQETGEWTWVTYQPASLETLGPIAARAAVSAEDANFWLHNGFDWEALCKAYEKYDADAARLRGGSTISQQVAKNVFLWQTRSFVRKGLEVYYTALLELLVPKERILELYLNVAETGRMTFGFEAGAYRYWKIPAGKLSRDQAAGLASILPSPQKWSPTRDPAARRARWVLANPAPFPGDRGWDAVLAKWNETGAGPLDCW
ncbi:MAG: monofunctional biosynthetic peptidoglycan transglycosylase [Deltaproteobacteria bacterium]|nr:monofunctional biosynthetic peptidoglycan transglycosylase [Deltaproteobacteria bacterium]